MEELRLEVNECDESQASDAARTCFTLSESGWPCTGGGYSQLPTDATKSSGLWLRIASQSTCREVSGRV